MKKYFGVISAIIYLIVNLFIFHFRVNSIVLSLLILSSLALPFAYCGISPNDKRIKKYKFYIFGAAGELVIMLLAICLFESNILFPYREFVLNKYIFQKLYFLGGVHVIKELSEYVYCYVKFGRNISAEKIEG